VAGALGRADGGVIGDPIPGVNNNPGKMSAPWTAPAPGAMVPLMNMKRIPCPLCGAVCYRRGLVPHLQMKHGLSLADARKALEANRKALEADAAHLDNYDEALRQLAQMRAAFDLPELEAFEAQIREKAEAYERSLVDVWPQADAQRQDGAE
jgi:hypothetical protein